MGSLFLRSTAPRKIRLFKVSNLSDRLLTVDGVAFEAHAGIGLVLRRVLRRERPNGVVAEVAIAARIDFLIVRTSAKGGYVGIPKRVGRSPHDKAGVLIELSADDFTLGFTKHRDNARGLVFAERIELDRKLALRGTVVGSEQNAPIAATTARQHKNTERRCSGTVRVGEFETSEERAGIGDAAGNDGQTVWLGNERRENVTADDDDGKA